MPTLRGIVKEKGSDDPIPWVSVMLDNKPNITDSNGMFLYKDISEGTHRLAIRTMFYRPVTLNIVIDKPMNNVSILLESTLL